MKTRPTISKAFYTWRLHLFSLGIYENSSRLSDYDLDIVSPLETSKYMAPEAIAGGVAAASDWWSLGVILLEQITKGACFEGVNEKAFLIHVLTNGITLPSDIDDSVRCLLLGLLARDRRERWQWKEVKAWLAGEATAPPAASREKPESSAATPITLGGKSYDKASRFALAAAQLTNWKEAVSHLLFGTLASWIQDIGADPKIAAGIREITRIEGLSDDLRLSLALKLIHPAMPLIVRGDIVTPGWLFDNLAEGYELLKGPAPDFLRRMDCELWLHRLKERDVALRDRAKRLDISLNEEELRIHLLSTSRARLLTLWEARRRLLPDTNHPGLISLIEHRQTTEEDLILLLSASVGQFRSTAEIVEEAAATAERVGIQTFSKETAETILASTRQQIFKLVEERTENFGRCGILKVDEWADQFRLERRMPIDRAVALLMVDKKEWKEPAKQAYVSTLLTFFGKKIGGAAMRGPLTRMRIGKTSARIDLRELESERNSAMALLDHLLARTDLMLNVDPTVFSRSETLDRRLRSLCSQSLLYQRDTGINGLYLAFPFFLMRDLRGSTRTRIAPVLLWPIQIHLEIGNRGHATIGFDRDREEVRLNPAFEGLIGIEGTARWREAANDLLGRATVTAGDVMDALSSLATPLGSSLVSLPGPDYEVPPTRSELVCSAVLFHLAYMGQSVVEDLSHLRSIPPSGSALETALRVVDTCTHSSAYSPPPELERYFTAPSDPSQEAAVIQAREAPGLLVEGPPGTGKSQTIVNMVADGIGRGKSVLVVCQKQAALEVVYKRLEREGLRDRMVMVSDTNKDREPTIRAIREQLEKLLGRNPEPRQVNAEDRAFLASRIGTIENYLNNHHTALHRIDDLTGLSYRAVLSELISLDSEGKPPLEAPALRLQLGRLNLAELAVMQDACCPLVRHWLPAKFEDSPLAALRIFSSDGAMVQLFDATFTQFEQLEDRRKLLNQQHPNCIEIADPTPYRTWLQNHAPRFYELDDSVRVELARWLGLFRRSQDKEDYAPKVIAGLLEVETKLQALISQSSSAALSQFCAKLSDEDIGNTLTLVTKMAESKSPWNPFCWLRKRRLLNFCRLHGTEEVVQDLSALEKALKDEQSFRQARHRLKGLISKLQEGDILAPDTPKEELERFADSFGKALRRVEDLVKAVDEFPDRPRLEAAITTESARGFEALASKVEGSLRVLEARSASLQCLDELTNWFEAPWIAKCRNIIRNAQDSSGTLSEIRSAFPTLIAYQSYRIRARDLHPDGAKLLEALRPYREALSAINPESLETELRRVFSREAHIAWMSRLMTKEPALLCEADEIKRKIQQLREYDGKMREANRDLLTRGIDVGKLSAHRKWEDITRLRGQRAQRLREFIDKGADFGLMTLRPVWLMNPDVASRVLPLKNGMFDIVIYDEASQLPVEYALPTLFRARTVVISGDEKQMPPTSFFSSKVKDDEGEMFDGEVPDDDAGQEEVEAYAETWNRRDIKDCPDLLHLGRTFLPKSMLRIHYRSAYRELIGFSNAAFYGNNLHVPARHPDSEVCRIRPIELVQVNGLYEDQTNQAEAEEVVKVLGKLWDVPPGQRPSIGIATFNRKQADCIEELLEERAQTDQNLREILSQERDRTEGGQDMGFFVKNVENVQGDERDVVIFSTTFGRNKQGTFRRKFGVLGQTGGERRLNVAVTRARTKVVIVTSMPLGEISDILSTHRVPSIARDYLQIYLEYARAMSSGDLAGGRTLISRIVMSRPETSAKDETKQDGFINSVGGFLRSKGYKVVRATDGAFGLDFAIENPRTGLYGVGIECDAPRNDLLETARARELWRQDVLLRGISKIHRVSSHAWYHQGENERRLLSAAIEQVIH